MKKRIISLLLVLAMALSLLPAAFAEEAKPPFTVVVSMEGLTLGQGLYF